MRLSDFIVLKAILTEHPQNNMLRNCNIVVLNADIEALYILTNSHKVLTEGE